LNLLIYLDEGLIRNLNSVALDGYIDIRTFRQVQDRTFGGNVRFLDRDSCSNDYKYQKDKDIRYKSKHQTFGDSIQKSKENIFSLDAKDGTRNEEEVKIISTSYKLHYDLLDNLRNSNTVKSIEKLDYKNENQVLNVGDLIEIKGCIKETSILSYLNTLLNSLNWYDTSYLNDLIKEEKLGPLNFDIIKKILTSIKEDLIKNHTKDLIVTNGDSNMIVNVNEKNFFSSDANMFDFLNCSTTIFGKVMMIDNDEDCMVSLLRKTSQQEYYKKNLEIINNYLRIIKDKGILIPNIMECNLKGRILMILPISICI